MRIILRHAASQCRNQLARIVLPCGPHIHKLIPAPPQLGAYLRLRLLVAVLASLHQAVLQSQKLGDILFNPAFMPSVV